MAVARDSARREPKGRLTLWGHFTSLPTGKAVLMLSLCKLPFVFREVALFDREQHGEEFSRLNPARQVPVLQRGRSYIRQSAAILLYLSELSGKFGGRSDAEKRAILEWLFFDADMVASLRIPRTLTIIFDGRQPEVCAYHRERGRKALALLDDVLRERPFVVGRQPTVADIAMFPVIDNAGEADVEIASFRGVKAWRRRMLELPGCMNHYTLMERYTAVDMTSTPAALAAEKSGVRGSG
jgi:glutathione S-transferase